MQEKVLKQKVVGGEIAGLILLQAVKQPDISIYIYKYHIQVI